MNHQIKYDANMRYTRIVRTKPIHFNERRLVYMFCHLYHSRVESFNMSHLQNQSISLSQFDQIFSFFQARR